MKKGMKVASVGLAVALSLGFATVGDGYIKSADAAQTPAVSSSQPAKAAHPHTGVCHQATGATTATKCKHRGHKHHTGAAHTHAHKK